MANSACSPGHASQQWNSSLSLASLSYKNRLTNVDMGLLSLEGCCHASTGDHKSHSILLAP
jgi:hypothetical protein